MATYQIGEEIVAYGELPVDYDENYNLIYETRRVGTVRLLWQDISSNPYSKISLQLQFDYSNSAIRGNVYGVKLDYSFNGDFIFDEYKDTTQLKVDNSTSGTTISDNNDLRVIYNSLDGKVTFNYDVKINLTDENGSPISWSGEVSEIVKTPPYYIKLINAPNFSDEENPTISLSVPTTYLKYKFSDYKRYCATGLQGIIAIDGENSIVRDIATFTKDTNITSYTFNLTDEERQLLINSVTNGVSKNVTFRLRTIAATNNPYGDYYDDLTKTFTLTDAYPSATLTVEDIDAKTLALTGDKDTIVKYCSDAAYVINATASKGATIISEQVTCGNKTSTTETGVIPDVESNIFNFYATDSRNNGVAGTLTKKFVDYVKLTCQQKVEFNLDGADSTGAAATVKISGNYFNGSFGLTNNSLVVQIRHTQNNGSMSGWITLSNVSVSNNSYSAEFNLNGLDYSEAYTFQCRATDKIETIETAEFTTRVMPVFDWSGDDFNFNVPININADTVDMGGNTVLRHTGTNTVLSGNNGNIYLRPNGTNSTSSETIFYGNGNIEFGGTVNFGNSFTVGGYILNDFVIDYGEEAMGTNGTWYWRKWLSGKAECWGCRNFGNMAINTAFGSLYRSAIFSQNLPDDLFKTTPDVINIQMLNGGNGCWIAKWNDVAPSAVTSGSFIVINATSGNITPSNISFYAAGMWQ